MATTTNYGWTTPDDTALVKDGASAIRTLGSSIDSTLKTQIDAQIPDALLTTKGDIIAASGASTPARLAVGADNTVLTADSTTATGMKWATVLAGATINYQAFTSSTTWTVPTAAKYVDVLVVGGGTGGRGGSRSTTASGTGGAGGGVTLVKDIYLGGTGTVSIVVGAGSSGSAGTATTTMGTATSAAGYSGFGTYAYSSGASGAGNNAGTPGYKGTASIAGPTSFYFTADANQANWAPPMVPFGTGIAFFSASLTGDTYMTQGINAQGFFGGNPGATNDNTNGFMRAGMTPGMGVTGSTIGTNAQNQTTNTMPVAIPSIYFTPIGAATAGTLGQGSTGSVGAAGVSGFAGGGGTCIPAVNGNGGQGGPGAGGGGSYPSALGLNGGNGGNAGTNTGAGGGAGANTGSTTAGTGGNGGNGAAGIVIVKWIS